MYDPIYEPTFRHFHERWQNLEERAAPEIRDRAQVAVDACREIMASHARRLAEQAAETSRREELQLARKKATEQAEADHRRRSEEAAADAAEAARVREAEEKARAEARAAEVLAQRRIGGLAARALSALREGHTGQAAGLRRAIEEKLPRLAAVPGHLAAQVHELDAKLDELKQWKDYAVAPKRAELIAEMESLIGSFEPPKALAERINQLKEDWRTISKGVISESEADWQRFHTASVTAYQPCRDYFEAQSKLRRENLERRRSLLGRLQAFEAGQSGERFDPRLAATVLREARQEWRRNTPVDRAAGLAVVKDFEASMARLQAQLDAWYAQVTAAKQALIQRARLLGDLQDFRSALDAMKGLQLQWKQAAVLPRDQEQRLWEEFREQCDAIYRRRQQAQTDRDAGLEVNKAQALALCLEVEQVAVLSGSALLEGTAKLADWRTAFDALGELPRAEQRAIRDRFEAAVKQCRSQAATTARDAARGGIRRVARGGAPHSGLWMGGGARHRAGRSGAAPGGGRELHRRHPDLAQGRRGGPEGGLGKGRGGGRHRHGGAGTRIEDAVRAQRDSRRPADAAGGSVDAPGTSSAASRGAHGTRGRGGRRRPRRVGIGVGAHRTRRSRGARVPAGAIPPLPVSRGRSAASSGGAA